jgi:hypothetical protein
MIKRLLKLLLEWAGYGSNAWTVLGWLGWTTPLVGLGAGAVTFFSSAVENWSVTAVLLASSASAALASLAWLAAAISYRLIRPISVSEGVTSKSNRPLPIALSVESLGSYMRTSPRVDRLDETIAKMGRAQMNNDGTLAYGLFPDLKSLGVVNIAEVDALLEEKEELVLHSATHWIFKDGVHRGQCVWELCKVMKAERGKDNYTKKIIEAYLAAKGAG